MIEEGMIFSDYDEFGEERYYCVTEVYDDLEERTFGAKSKLLGFFAPGAYQAKEAAKYGYDDYDEYKKDRAGYALKGLFTPGTATYMKKKAQQMYEDGKSTKEIREFLENKGKYHSNGRIAAGVAEALIVPSKTITLTAAKGVGLYDKFTGKRKDLHSKK